MSGNDRPQNTDGLKRASEQAAFRPQLPKRFYRDVTVERRDEHWLVLLDGREIKTPGKHRLALPTEALANALAGEWRAQEKVIDPATMPVTRIANAAIEGVADNLQPVANDIVSYAASDLLCYRASGPHALTVRQANAWDPVLAWAETELSARFVLAEGVMPVDQPRETLDRISEALRPMNAFQLAGLHVVTTLTGSAILALSIFKGHMSAAAAWSASHVDEDYQIEQWGEDGEAKARRAMRWPDMNAASAFLSQCSD